ncbi:MAG: SDR family NAD(P)-dependent oxidoreductase [Planctomycetota bacterium]|nr:SDR family NAD(P)-dependent oxidoreductase [Planctomycetota bacterium]
MARNVLIFGANSAIASEVARAYSKRGDRLFLVGRNPQSLQSLVTELGGSVAGQITTDLDELDSCAAHVQTAIDTLGTVDIALVAHGLLGDQGQSERDLEHARQIIQTNFLSAVSILIPLTNYFEKQGRGHLGVITSVAGERGRPRNYTYGASKGALTRYLQGIRSRLYPTDAWVHNLKLGPVDTPMTVGHNKHALFGEKTKVARGIVKTLDGHRHVTYLPRTWGYVMMVVRCLPEPIFQRFGFLAGR